MSRRRFNPNELERYMSHPRSLRYSIRNTENIPDYFPNIFKTQGEIFSGNTPNYWRKIEFINDFRIRSGAYFELLSHQIFGGTLLGLKSMSGFNGFKPDIVNYLENIIREVKSCKWGDCLKLTDHKIGEYALMQSYRSFLPKDQRELLKTFEISFDCFKYYLTKPTEFFMKKTTDKKQLFNEIFNTMSQETAFLLSLPFSVIWEIHKNSSRYDEKHWDSYSRFNMPMMQELLTKPHRTLENELALNPDDYKIKRTRIPRTMEICGRSIKPFPVLLIRHRSRQQHDKWVDQFVEENREYLEDQKDMTREELRYNTESIKGDEAGENKATAMEMDLQRNFLNCLLEPGEFPEDSKVEEGGEFPDKVPF